jgi:hypothetical protein
MRHPAILAVFALTLAILVPQQGLAAVPSAAPTTSSSSGGKTGSSHHHHKRKRRHTVKSDGARFTTQLGTLTVEAPKGAIRKGQTLTVEAGSPKKFPAVGAPSLVGGPYTVSTSQGEPAKPVEVTFRYDRGKLGDGRPLVVHGQAGFGWVPEPTSGKPSAATVSAQLAGFSPIDVVDGITWAAGDLVGNRTDLPSGCGPSPSWIDWLSPIYSRNDSLPACTGAESNDQTLYIHVANNRGYAQYLTVSNATVDVRRSSWGDSLESTVAAQIAAHSRSGAPSSFLLAPGSHAVLAIDRPPEGFGLTAVSILAAPRGSSAMAAMGWALLNKVRSELGNKVDLVNCVAGDLYGSLAADPGVSSAIGQLRSCAGAAAAGLRGSAKEVLEKIGSAVLVTDFFYKVIDLQADEALPPTIKFSIHGRNPTSPSIHVRPLALGTVPAGRQTVAQLSADGGSAPYSFTISHAASNIAKVPSWVHLASNGALTIDPPVGSVGSVGFYVYATDAGGHSSPFERDEVTFTVGSDGGGGDGDGTMSWSGIEAPLPAGGDYSRLFSTTCPSPNECIAVGDFMTSFHQQGLIETFANGAWTAIEAPQPANGGGGSGASVDSVACTTDATICVAVGEYHSPDPSPQRLGLILTRVAGIWTASEAPTPPGSTSAALAGVACGEVSCIAVGTASGAEALVETFVNGTWTASEAPLPADGVTSYQQVRSAACSGSACFAAGVYTDAGGRHHDLIEILSGGVLTPLDAAPSGGYLDAELDAIACPPAGACMASGGYLAGDGSGHMLVGTVGSGGSWAR